MKLKLFFQQYSSLAALVLAGVILRVLYINWGLPELYEEATPMDIAWKFWNFGGKGLDFNPHFFNYPALTFFIHFLAQALYYAVGHVTGVYASLAEFATTQSPIVILARSVTVLIDAGTIIVVYLISKNTADKRTALLATMLTAFNPLHIIQSHLIQVDTPLTFFTALAMLGILRCMEKQQKNIFLLTGIAIGAATASKYTGALLALILLIAFVVKSGSVEKAFKHGSERFLFYAFGAAAATFFLCNPYIILNFSEFSADFAFERQHASYGHLGVVASNSTIGYYLIDIIAGYIGWLLLAFAIVAGILFAKQKEKKNLILLSFPVLYLLFLSTWEMRAERYILPAFPLIIVIGSIGIMRVWDMVVKQNKERNRPTHPTGQAVALALCGVLALVQPSFGTYGYLHSLSLPDTRLLTKQWITEHAPKGSAIATGPYGVDFPRNQYSMLYIPFLAFESERVAAFYDTRWYENVDILITSDYDYARYKQEPERYKEFLPFYDSLKSTWQLLYSIESDKEHTGPSFWLYRCPDSLKRKQFDQSLFERFSANPESARISNFLKQLNEISLKKNELHKSAQIMNEILLVEVGNLQLRNKLSALYIELHMYEEALKHLQLSTQILRSQPQVFAMAGRCLLRLNRLREAEATLITALNTDRKIISAYEDLIELYTFTKESDKLKSVVANYSAVYPQKAKQLEGVTAEIERQKSKEGTGK